MDKDKVLALALRLQQLLNQYDLNVIYNIDIIKATTDSLVEELTHDKD